MADHRRDRRIRMRFPAQPWLLMAVWEILAQRRVPRVSVEITAKDAKVAKGSKATICAILCYPDAVGSWNIGELRRVR